MQQSNVISPSGENYLAALASFFDRKGSEVMSGRLSLYLQPRALEYIAGRLGSLTELERMKQYSPVDFFRGCASDMQDFKRLEKLQHVLQRVRKLRVHAMASKLRDPTRVNVSPFRMLTHLELVACDLSTSAWLGLETIRLTLQSLACYDSMEELRHLLAPSSGGFRSPGSRDGAVWPQLTSLTCSHNSFSMMDASLMLLPAVERINLANNNISTLQNLTACTSVVELNLSSNSIASLGQVGLCTGPIRRLILQGNVIKSTQGVQLLRNLEELDFRCNLISSIHEVVRLSGLSSLQQLWLEANPIACARLYRIDVLACFPESQGVLLDGKPDRRSEREMAALRALGNAPPDSWRVMERFVSQPNHFLPWGPPVYSETPLPEEFWMPESPTASTADASDSAAASSASHTGSRGRIHRKAPARRIVEFSLQPEQPSSTSQEGDPGSPPLFPSSSSGNRGGVSSGRRRSGSGSGGRGLRSSGRLSTQSSSSHGEDIRYYDLKERQKSPPRYERAVLDRLHEVLPAVGHDVLPADTGWESGSDTPSAASSAGSDGSVSPELMRSTSRLLSGSFQLGFAGPS